MSQMLLKTTTPGTGEVCHGGADALDIPTIIIDTIPITLEIVILIIR